MNVGEIQRLLSLKAEKEPDHRFDDLYGLLCNKDWLRLAHDYVAQNAGSVTAGCDGINMRDFDEDLEGNLQRLREALKKNRSQPCPVRRVHIPKGNGKPITSSKAGGLIRNRSKRFGLLIPVKQAEFVQPFVFTFLVLDVGTDNLLVRTDG